MTLILHKSQVHCSLVLCKDELAGTCRLQNIRAHIFAAGFYGETMQQIFCKSSLQFTVVGVWQVTVERKRWRKTTWVKFSASPVARTKQFFIEDVS